MFGVIAAILLLTESASAGAPPAPASRLPATPTIPSCVIPVYINLGAATPDQIPTYLGAAYNSLRKWNEARTGVLFGLEELMYTSDRKEGAIVITMSAFPEDRPDSEIGLTYNVGKAGDGISRSRILLNVQDPWCITGGNQNNCYQMESVLTHELGHALGLHHNDNPASVMLYGISQGAVKSISPADVAAVKALFPQRALNCSSDTGIMTWATSGDN